MSNRRRHDLEIKPDQMTGVHPAFAAALNDRLTRVAEALESGSGLRGSVRIALQKKFEVIKARTDIRELGLHLEDNRIGMAADAIDPQDLVTLKQAKLLIDARDADASNDITDSIDDEDPVNGTLSTSPIDHYYGLGPPLSNTNYGLVAADFLHVCAFNLPMTMTVRHIVFEIVANFGTGISLLSIGLYDTNKQLVLTTGPQNTLGLGLRNISVSPTILDAGTYYLGFTTDSVGVARYQSNDSIYPKTMFNVNKARKGKAVATAGAVLPTTFTTIVETDEVAPLVLFDSV